jgi:hypothetical protein
MATPGRVQVSPGQVVSSLTDNQRWDQSIQRFDTTADRDAQFPAPHQGAMCFVADVARWYGYRNGAWQALSFGSAGAFGFGKGTTAQPIPNGVSTPVALQLDGASRGVTLTGGTTLVADVAGLYVMVATLTFSHNAAGSRSAFLRRNGNAAFYRAVGGLGSTTGSITCSTVFPMAAGDTLDLLAYQSSGASLTLDSNSNGCQLVMAQI